VGSKKADILSKLSQEWASLARIAKSSRCGIKTAKRWLDEFVRDGIADHDGESYRLNRNATKTLRAKAEKLQEDLNVLEKERGQTELRWDGDLSRTVGLDWRNNPSLVKYFRRSMKKFDDAKKVWEKELEEIRMELRKLEESS